MVLVLSELLEEVLVLQRSWSKTNTPEMQRRGRIIRDEIPSWLSPRMDLFRGAVPAVVDLSVEGRDATGNKNQVPWVRLHSKEKSPNAQTGWYVVYLFHAHGERVYLCLCHGSTQNTGAGMGLPNFRPRSPSEMHQLMNWADGRLGLQAARPGYVNQISLEASTPLGAAYEGTTVGAVEYLAGGVPDDTTLEADILHMLTLLNVLSLAEEQDPAVPGKPAHELVHVMDEIERQARPNTLPSHGQGFGLDASERKAVEDQAMKLAVAHLNIMGYPHVEDVSRTCSYDLHARSDTGELRVEVKGTTSDGAKILLTRNEVRLHREVFPNNALIVVSHIQLHRGDNPTADAGELTAWHPWKLEEGQLEPLGYEYSMKPSVAAHTATAVTSS